jgi:hypothetical protein
MHQRIYLVVGTFILSTSFGCAIQTQNQVMDGHNLIITSTTNLISYQSKTNRPTTKTATITIEGEQNSITLKLYDQYSNLFTTYYPKKDFLPEAVSSGEGTGVRFIANFGGNRNQNAYVSVSFLNSFKTLEQLRNFVSGNNGLIASNKWQVVSRTRNTPYRWAKEKIVFNKKQGTQNITGTVYLGQQKDKVFYVMTHYPVEYGDGFPPRANFILQNLEVSSS